MRLSLAIDHNVEFNKQGKREFVNLYLEAPGCIAALSSVAYRVVHITFVDVLTRFTRVVDFISGITYAPIVSDSVFASTVRANRRILSTLVYV